MMLSLVLIEGQNVSEETLRSVSLGNAKQLVVGNAYGFGVILHLAATSLADLGNALRAFAQVPGVTGVLTLALRTSQRASEAPVAFASRFARFRV
jgi:O-acetylhomoserine/O-acetylserine sulfhydrylase-like pyridoxal-dependent enzyme